MEFHSFSPSEPALIVNHRLRRKIEIQAKNVFFCVFASAIGGIFVFSDDFKPHFCSTLIDPMLSVAALAKIVSASIPERAETLSAKLELSLEFS